MNRSDLDEIVRDLWATRPARRREGRKIAGVAAAIGRRYRIDPILVRVALVVATVFGGAGVFVYLIGWLALPEHDGESSALESLFGHGHSSMSRPLTVVLLVALIPAVSASIGGGVSGPLALGAVAAAVYLMHKHRAALGEPGSPGLAGVGAAPGLPPVATAGPVPPHAGSAWTHGMSHTGHCSATTAPTVPVAGAVPPATARPAHAGPADPAATGEPPGPTPPAWDPLGVAPFAWDLPEPTPQPAPQQERAPRRRSAVTPATLGLTLVTAGTAGILATTSDAIGAREVAAVALATVGLGLLVGSFTRGGRGLIGAAIPLAIVTFFLSVVPTGGFGADEVGTRVWTANTAADVQPRYALSTGESTLDLSALRLEDGDRVVTAVEQGAGRMVVILPADADVEVRCETGVGHVECLGETTDGVRPGSDLVRDDGADGDGGGTIVLDASLGMGEMQVRRG